MYAALAEHLVLPVVERVTRLPFWREYHRLKREERLGRDEIRRLQLERLRSILGLAYEKVRLYRERYTAAGVHPDDLLMLSDLPRFPVMTKDALRQAFPERALAPGADPKRLILKSTSGTTGVPFRSVIDRADRARQMARTILGFEWAGAPFGEKVAVIVALSDRRNLTRKLYEAVKREHRFFLPSFDPMAIERVANRLCQLRPKLLMAPITPLLALADFVARRGMLDLRPGVIQAVAANLFDGQRRYFERVFGCPVISSYGCNEIYVVAQECRLQDGMHVVAPDVIVEVVRRDGSPAAAEELGLVLLTDLHNRVMPLIRYDIGDLGRPVAGSCPCGHPFPLVRISDGRTSELMITPKGRFLGAAHYVELMQNYPWVECFQFEQREPDRILLRLKVSRAVGPDALADLITRCGRLADDSVTFEIDFVDEIPIEPNGKTRYFKSRVRHELSGFSGPQPTHH